MILPLFGLGFPPSFRFVVVVVFIASPSKSKSIFSSSFSQKDLENLKAEVQRRQQLQELGKSEEPAEESPLELEDKIPID